MLFHIASTTSATGNSLSMFRVMANGSVYVDNRSGTTTKQRPLNEPDMINSVSTANYMSTYSDDISRTLQCGTAAGSNIGLRNGSFSASAATNVFLPSQGVKGQLITWTTLYNNVVLGRGCMTHEGYHYVMVASSTGFLFTSAIRRATSSDFVNIASSTAWATATISGAPLFSTSYLVGASEGAIYVASSSATQIQKYLISTSTNTLTSDTYYNITGAAVSISSTRVNNNGLYVGFTSASEAFLRKYDFTGVLANGAGYVAAAPSTTGPDLFVMKNSTYALMGGTAAFMTRIAGY